MSAPLAASGLKVVEIKAFVPAKDFELSKRFYADLGFTQRSEGGGLGAAQEGWKRDSDDHDG